MQMQTHRMSVQLSDEAGQPEAKDLPAFTEPDKQTQIRGLILTDPKAARAELALFPLCLDLARRKARAAGLSQGALFCSLDPKSHPCHPDEPPEIPLKVQPSFELSRLLIDYYRTSLDFQFLLAGGADVIFETARLWHEIQATRQGTAPGEAAAVQSLVQLNLNWTGRLWTMLGHAAKQQNLAARLGLTDQEIQTLAGLAGSQPLPAPDRQAGLAARRLAAQFRQWHSPLPVVLPNEQEAGYVAILATEIAGLAIEDEELTFTPGLPAGWQSYALRLAFRGSKFELQVNGSWGKMILTEGSAIPVVVYGLEYLLEDVFVFGLKAISGFEG